MKLTQPNLIKIAAVVTAAPRWVIALLAAEGFLLPESWLGWWVIVSAILSLGMAIVEGMAFSYIFNAWKAQKDKRADILFAIALFSALVFVGVMSPSISAGVRRVPLGDLLTEDWTLHLWSVAVSLSTITIVAGVGYAEKHIETEKKPESFRVKAETASKEKEKLPESPRQLTGNFPPLPESIQADDRILSSWTEISLEDKHRIAGMTTREIMGEFGLTERTARNWRAKAGQNGKA